MTKLALLVALSALLFAACAGATSAPAADGAVKALPAVRGEVPIGAPAPAVGDPSSAFQAGRGVAVAQPAGQPQPVPVPLAFDPERALILTATVGMRAKDPWAISDRVQAIAVGLGGDVMGLSQSGSGEQRSATVTLRVPQQRFNDALRQIRDIADVEVVSSSVEGKDVTDQFVDLQARLRAKQAEEQRYLALLARADKIEDILRIDQVLAQTRTQIEQLTGQLNSIKARTEFSTIAITIAPLPISPAPTPDPKAYDPSKTIERAISALVSVVRVFADAAIWTLVFGWIPLVLFGLIVLVSRTRARIAPTA